MHGRHNLYLDVHVNGLIRFYRKPHTAVPSQVVHPGVRVKWYTISSNYNVVICPVVHSHESSSNLSSTGKRCQVVLQQLQNFDCNYSKQAITCLLADRACLVKSNIVFAEPPFGLAELYWQWLSRKLFTFELWRTSLLERWPPVSFHQTASILAFPTWKCNTLVVVKTTFVQLLDLEKPG